MTPEETLLAAKELFGTQTNRHQLASVAYEVIAALSESNRKMGSMESLRQAFMAYINHYGFADAAMEHAEYAKLIAGDEAELLYEEMHKLFSLCDETGALVELGCELPQEDRETLKTIVMARFQREPDKAFQAALHNFASWKAKWWWYSNFPTLK